MNNHPYTRYAEAVIIVEHELSSSDQITSKHISIELEKGLNSFRLAPSSSFEGKKRVSYTYIKEAKGDTGAGVFLSPNILTPDKQAKNIWNEGNNILKNLGKGDLGKSELVKMSIAPIAGEFLNFSLSSSIGRGKPKSTVKDIGLNSVSTITPLKPCLQYRIDKKPRPDLFNVCIIPDLPFHDLVNFVFLFKKLLFSKTSADLLVGDVLNKTEGKGDNEKTTYQPKRPLIYRGNFPNPPRSSVLGSVALLGAIGEFAKEAEVSSLAMKVLDSLKEATMYMIKYGGALTFTYNHHVVDLAKEGKLREIVDSVYYTQLYNEGRRKSQSTEYQKFDLFASRFLQLFNKPSFRDFLSHRAEYPFQLDILFNTYFKKIEMIDPEIVVSARKLGRWLNQVAYFAAKREVNNGSQNYWEELRKAKSKVLIELESSTFSAKSGDALIAQAITRAGRISGMDAPEGATLFMEKTSSGDLALDNAKNLLIAFSRLKNKVELKEQPKDDLSEDDAEQTDESDDLSND
ncbi:type I-PGING CRISPR-associated protein Cas8c/Csp2 [Algoriphagus sp. AGSA1]|uniref:type I-PGING CRISPR-associated protein Cas8c/Csp2 n=1 Tax=Algoriphagus sp. AGSA1 TaxID=2907213 RepID=UPI001F1DA046|nr:type I-PGING CRISPR-associated protein Cas8c/Csp2 [Algoriphagus sp. AGSA1]MCE7057706.1 type I-PGING CRISPR-associated protein Cas8c/Csp2 [Algoriphagus sp. AGSA1]